MAWEASKTIAEADHIRQSQNDGSDPCSAKSLACAATILSGIEMVHMTRKRQARSFNPAPPLVEQFDILTAWARPRFSFTYARVCDSAQNPAGRLSKIAVNQGRRIVNSVSQSAARSNSSLERRCLRHTSYMTCASVRNRSPMPYGGHGGEPPKGRRRSATGILPSSGASSSVPTT